MCNVSPGSHVWTCGSQLLELFGKAVAPSGGGALVEKVGHWVGLEVLGFQFLGHFVPPVRWCSVLNWSSALVPCFLHCGGHHPPGAGDHNKPFLFKLYLSRYLTTTRRKIRHFPKKLSPGPRGFAHEICFKTLPDLEGKRHFLTHSLMLVLLPLNPSQCPLWAHMILSMLLANWTQDMFWSQHTGLSDIYPRNARPAWCRKTVSSTVLLTVLLKATWSYWGRKSIWQSSVFISDKNSAK